MSETMNAGKRRAAVPVDSGVASGGRHRLDPTLSAPPNGHPAEPGDSGRTRARWFRRG
ncbi:hypothetical protein [Aeromicrobium sp. Sec7.5]|uniref:hypothetical protein n=1 Tax=Aeromicrobium sp. Sec7.5 TaxID=3121276 RepID=UPI002FE4DDB5